jgi:rubrerythrin
LILVVATAILNCDYSPEICFKLEEDEMGDSVKDQDSQTEYDGELDLQILREDLAAELLAINQYQQHIESLTDTDAIKTLEQINESKKEYVAELIDIIKKLDFSQAKKLERRKL